MTSATRARALRWGLVVLALLPILVLLARVAFTTWHPNSDQALIELRTRDVGTLHTPLLGPYSRFGWNHPGPLLYYLLALPYRIAGSNGRALLLGTLLINGAAIAGIVLVLLRRGGVALALWGGFLLALLLRSLGGQFLWSPWNPFVPVLPFFLFVLLAWSVATGDWWCLPIAAALACFIVQSHVGFAIVVAVVAVVALVLAFVDRDARRKPAVRPAVLWSAGIFVALWIPPIVEEIVNTNGGNIHKLLDFWFSHRPTPGLAEGYHVVARYLTLWSPWLGHGEAVEPFSGHMVLSGRQYPVLPLVVIAAGWLAWRARSTEAVKLAILLVAIIGAAWYSASRIIGGVDTYLVRWFWTIGPLVWLAAGAAVIAAVRAREPSTSTSTSTRYRWAAAIAAGAVAAGAIVAAVDASAAPVPVPDHSRALAVLGPQLVRYLHHPGEKIALVPSASFDSLQFRVGVAAELERAGYKVTVEKNLENGWGTERARGRSGVPIIVAAGLQIEATEARGARMVASYDELTPAERAEANALQARLLPNGLQELPASVRHSAAFQRLVELGRRDLRVAVFVP